MLRRWLAFTKIHGKFPNVPLMLYLSPSLTVITEGRKDGLIVADKICQGHLMAGIQLGKLGGAGALVCQVGVVTVQA